MKNIFTVFLFAVIAILIIAGAAWGIGRIQLNARLEDEKSRSLSTLTLDTTQSLKVTPLFEADGLPGFEIGHGVSYWIETDQATILLDAGFGQDYAVEKNLKALGLDPQSLNAIMLSHKHPDHVGGYNAFFKNTFSFTREPVDFSTKAIFLPRALNIPGGNPIVAEDPQIIAPGVGTSGTFIFQELFPFSILSGWQAEHALVINLENRGLVIITSCGHPGLEQITEQVESVYQVPVIGIIGGLHYVAATNAQVAQGVQYMQEHLFQFAALSPHDSKPEQIELFRQAFGEHYYDIKVGQTIQP